MYYKIFYLFILVCIVATLSIATLMFGKNIYTCSQLCHIHLTNRSDYFILYDIRLPRLIISLYCGMLFALAGSIFQSVYRNQVASPDILGVNATAIFSILIFSNMLGSQHSLFAYALIGAMAGFGLTIVLATNNKKIVATRLIIIGLAISILFRALSQLLVIQSSERLHNLLAFLNGSLYQASWASVHSITYPAIMLIAICLIFAHYLDIIVLNPEVVKAIGMKLGVWQMFFIALALLMSAVAVSVSGSLGFIGLIAPNIARLIFGYSHRYNLCGSLLLGCILILGADLVARAALYPLEIPTGIVMIFLGTPIFVFLLKNVNR